MRTAQRQACNELIETLYTLTDHFGAGRDCKYVYDGKHTLYTTKEIKLQRQTTTIKPNQMLEQTAKFVKNEPVYVTITPNESIPKLDYSNLSSALVNDVSVQADRSVRTFLELLTSQFFINSREYQNVSVGTLFENRTKYLVPGMDMRVGFKKGVRVTNDDKGKTCALLVVDMKRTAFFANKKLSDIYSEFLNEPGAKYQDPTKKFENHMKGVRVVVSYDPSRTFVFGYLDDQPLTSKKLSVQGKSLPQFMKEKHNLTIQNPQWRGVRPAGPKNSKVVYPIEALEVLHGQLVPIEKLHGQASRQLLMENSVQAKERYAYVQQQVLKLATGDSAAFLNHFGVSLDIESNKVKINQRQTPSIQYKDAVIKTDPKGAWMNEAVKRKFINPSNKLKNWIVVFENKFSSNKVQGFIRNLLTKARALGMVIEQPKEFISINVYNLQDVFDKNKGNLQFILYIDDVNQKFHDKLKLYETHYEILTQHVVAKNLDAQPQTLTNIAMKLNAKCFGLNYVALFPQQLKNYSLNCVDLLVIGMDVSHPKKMNGTEKYMFNKAYEGDVDPPENRHPSVVGICANKGADPFAFIGDFFYQQTCKEAINEQSLTKAVANIVAMAVKHGRRPKRIIVVRDGLSEGQMSMAANLELPAIRAGWRNGIPNTAETANLSCKITFVVCTKQHQKRFYRENGKDITNTNPGDVIDSGVTRIDQPEFYLQSHYPLKGVPKMPQYGVVTNELGMSMEDMQQLMVCLSNMHQVSATATSLPAPVYVAHETAKRGQNIYNELYAIRNSKRRPDASNFVSKFVMEKGVFNYDELTKELGYSGSRLAGTRFNA
ncbi:hypothetical protein M3Y98_01101200 [Aphelenchoides besseyi]|nr:hypothetical protein M3Y98_01101200 [Aphelenchoides besseyi]